MFVWCAAFKMAEGCLEQTLLLGFVVDAYVSKVEVSPLFYCFDETRKVTHPTTIHKGQEAGTLLAAPLGWLSSHALDH